jgi:hypothetical protein
MMGQWLFFIRKALAKVYTPGNEETYLPLVDLVASLRNLETIRWPVGALAPHPLPELGPELPDRGKGQTETLSALAWFIQHRNTHHGHYATLSDAEVSKALRQVFPRLQIILDGLSCLTEYRLVFRNRTSRSMTVLHGDDFSDFTSKPCDCEDIFTGPGFDRDEQVALIYPTGNFAVPLTHLVTRERSDDEFEGIVRFRTAAIEDEPLIFEGIDNQKKSIQYLGSGTRVARSSSYEAVRKLFDSHLTAEASAFHISAVDYLRFNVEGRLSALYGIKYQPQTFVKREIETKIKDTLLSGNSSSKPAILLIGKSGTGKTSLLCNFVQELLHHPDNKHHASLRLTQVIGASTPTIESGLAADLGYLNSVGAPHLQELLDYWADACIKRDIHKPFLWIVWDALNEGHDLETLLTWAGNAAENIARWNATSRYGQARLIISCRSEAWDTLVATQQGDEGIWPLQHAELFHNGKRQPGKPAPFWTLMKFSPREAQRAYECYQGWATRSFAPYASAAWMDLGKETREILCIPINCWLFHNIFPLRGGLSITSQSTSVLWREYLARSILRHPPMRQAIELFSELMWQSGASSVNWDEIRERCTGRFRLALEAYLASMGLTYQVFDTLPTEAKKKLLAGRRDLSDPPDEVEVLMVTGLFRPDGETLTPVYQTLSEALAEWNVWRNLLPKWEPSETGENDAFEFNLKEAERSAHDTLDHELASWVEKALWADARRALISVWATRAHCALQEGLNKEALQNLKELQLRGCADIVLDIIECSLGAVHDEQIRKLLFAVKVDMVHLQGRYRDAADLIDEMLAGLTEKQILSDQWHISQFIRLLHHKMFFCPVSPLLDKTKWALAAIDANAFPALFGELLFMAGGNLGMLAGDLPQATQYLLMAIAAGEQCNDDYLICRSLRKYADILRHDGQLESAALVWSRAWELSEKYRGTRQGIYLLCSMGDLKRQMGLYDESERYFHLCLELARKNGITGWIGHSYLGLAELGLDQEDASAARKWCQLANNCYASIKQQWGLIQVASCSARAALLDGSPWLEPAMEARDRSLEYGYGRDYVYNSMGIEEEKYSKNCLLFL